MEGWICRILYGVPNLLDRPVSRVQTTRGEFCADGEFRSPASVSGRGGCNPVGPSGSVRPPTGVFHLEPLPRLVRTRRTPIGPRPWRGGKGNRSILSCLPESAPSGARIRVGTAAVWGPSGCPEAWAAPFKAARRGSHRQALSGLDMDDPIIGFLPRHAIRGSSNGRQDRLSTYQQLSTIANIVGEKRYFGHPHQNY